MDLKADTTMTSALGGGSAGASTGALAGADAGAVAGEGTGRFARIAVPVSAGLGRALGAAAGATTGVLMGGLQGLPAEKAQRVTLYLAGVAMSRDFQEELRSAVEATVPRNRRSAANRADAAAILQLTHLELEQHLDDEISLRMRAKMSLEWGSNRENPHSQSHDYVYETSDRHIDDWLLDDGAAFDTSFTEGIATIAGEMSRDILSPEPR